MCAVGAHADKPFRIGTFGYSKDLVWLNTTDNDWEPAFAVSDQISQSVQRKIAAVKEELSSSGDVAETDGNGTKPAIEVLKREQSTQERDDIGRNSNFLLGTALLENNEDETYWVVDNFTGWQSLRFGEGARYYYVGVSALLEMHRGQLVCWCVGLLFNPLVVPSCWSRHQTSSPCICSAPCYFGVLGSGFCAWCCGGGSAVCGQQHYLG